jgi:DNA processing protein
MFTIMINSQIQNIEACFRSLNEAEKKSAPPELYLQGDVGLLAPSIKRVSIIGSRKCTSEGLRRTEKLVRKLVERGVVIVSGLAEGIDACAHQAAIKAGGKTIAVLGTPLTQVYPEKHRQLQEQIGKDHLLVSQFVGVHKILKGNFPRRNRLMALLCDVTVIMEAQDGSGTEHQGWEAIRLARPLWIPESAVNNSSLEWPKQFANYGATILSDSNIEELLRDKIDIPYVAWEDAQALF